MPIPFKFKAKNIETGEVAPVVGIFFNNFDKLTSIKVRIDDEIKIWTDFELFMWTGCKDCEGNRIYTGDVVKVNDIEYQIEFNRFDAFYMNSIDLSTPYLKLTDVCNDSKIIKSANSVDLQDEYLNKRSFGKKVFV